MKLFLLIFLCFSLELQAQSFQIYKGDTINRRDKNGLKQGVWKRYYPNDTLFSESIFKDGKHIGNFKTYTQNGNLQSDLHYRGISEISDAMLYYPNGSVEAKGKYVGQKKDS